ncbi:MAG: 1,2-phenylacetyl-CoA epoxidase subunit PaaC [Jatrophihabitantaceae bacterium]
MGFDTAYEGLAADDGDLRWAFGTGFHDALAGVDTTIPDGIGGVDLATYCLMLGDDALIMSHRLQQWLAHAPELEEETALANIGLDLLGQARMLLARAGAADGSGRTEDDYAFGRQVPEFLNVHLAEVTDADFGALVFRLLVFSTWRLALLTHLRDSRDPVLAAIAARGINELTYHRDYAAQWVVRLGDGTDYSRARVQDGLRAIVPLTGELFAATPLELRLARLCIAVDVTGLRSEVDAVLTQVCTAATLHWPGVADVAAHGGSGRDGQHTPAMAPLLGELQGLARSFPGALW